MISSPISHRRTRAHIEWFLPAVSYVLAVFGVICISIATFNPDRGTDLSLLNYIINSNSASWQAIFVPVSVVVLFVVINIPLELFKSRANLIYWGVLLLLLFTLLTATAISSVSAWLRVGWGRTIQPCEFAKLSILLMLAHVVYSVFAYLTMYYNPQLEYIMAIPFIVLVCLHAVCGMASVFLQADGTRMDLYPGKNMRTILQRVSAALIFPLLILHLYTFSLMKSSAESGNPGFIVLLILAELLFFACVITHVVVSLTKGLITLGLLSSQKVQKMIDRILYVAGAVVFFVSAFAVIRGQAAMFLH